jgi:hypothetical protein
MYTPRPFLFGFFGAKAYSKEISVYKAKSFVINNILGLKDGIGRFELEALAASSSGELTSMIYNCPDINRSGLILGFYNDFWNDNGVTYQGYKFKDIPKDKAIELFEKLNSIGEDNAQYLKQNTSTSNVSFTFEDITFLLYKGWSAGSPIRVFWGDFDVDWQAHAYNITEERFRKKTNN